MNTTIEINQTNTEQQKPTQTYRFESHGLSTVVVAAAGYRAITDKYAAVKKVRFAKDEVLVLV